MGLFDFVADVYSAISFSDAYAEERQNAGPEDNSADQSSSQDTRKGGMGTAQHDRDGGVRGGVSTKVPASGTDEESDEEKEVNAEDAEKASSRTASDDDDGADASRGGAAAPGDGGDDEEEEEEEDDDEPKDPKPRLEEECLRTQCHSTKHHYDECAERVQKQIDEDGKAKEDCVEEYFHMMHCATQCSAGKLFKQLR